MTHRQENIKNLIKQEIARREESYKERPTELTAELLEISKNMLLEFERLLKNQKEK